MVRALVAGVGGFSVPMLDEQDVAEGVAGLGPLPSVTPAVRELAWALDRLGVSVGDAVTECDRDDFLDRWVRLRRQAAPDEALVVHFAGHGIRPDSGGLFLAASGADGREAMLDESCVNVDSLLGEAERSGRPVLLLLDVCGAGQAVVRQQLAELGAGRRQDAARSVWVIGACAANQDAYGAGLTIATAEVLQQLVDGHLDLSPAVPYVPVETLAAIIDRRLAGIDAAAGRPRRSVVRTADHAATAAAPPFFRNPAHASTPTTAAAARLDPRLREFALGCAPGLDPLHFATRASGNPDATEIMFTGRASSLKTIGAWLDADPGAHGSLLAVTGGPGSGKSALLGVTACLLHPDLEPVLGRRVGNAVPGFEPAQPGTVLAVHARQMSLAEIVDALHAQLRRQHPADADSALWQETRTGPEGSETGADGEKSPTVGILGLVNKARAVGDVLIILDALDEAVDPESTVSKVLLPLARLRDTDAHADVGDIGRGAVRVLVGTRPWWDTLTLLRRVLADRPGSLLNLDPATDAERAALAADLEGYLHKLLPRRHPARPSVPDFAERLADYSDHGAFLVAALYADHLLATGGVGMATPPCSITQVFDLHRRTLAETDPWIWPVLAAVGRARGAGMPAELIHAVALAHRPPAADRPAPTLADTRRVLGKAAFYLRSTPDVDQRMLYRYFHQALIDYTGFEISAAAVHRALTATVPAHADGSADWTAAHPYLRRHAADHASQAGRFALDELLTNPSYLLHAEPDSLSPLLPHARIEQAVLHADIYRANTSSHRARHDPEARSDLLTLDALAWRQFPLANALASAVDGGNRPFTPRWATHHSVPDASSPVLTGHTSTVHTLAVATGVDGTRLAVTAGSDRVVKVWDLTTGRRRHTLKGHSSVVFAVAAATGRDGAPLAVTAGYDRSVLVWDLGTVGLRHILKGHTSVVLAAATTTVRDGTPLAVTAGDDGSAIVWDLESGARRRMLEGHTDTVWAVAVTTSADIAPLAITTSKDTTAIVWDLETGRRRHTLAGHTGGVLTVAVATGTDGTPLAVTAGHDGSVIVWDLKTGSRRHTMTGHTSAVLAAAVATGTDGTPLAVTTGHDRTVIVWDLETGARRHTLAGHNDTVRALAVATRADGTPLALTTGQDDTVVAWDLDAGEPVSRHHLPCAGYGLAAVDSGGFVVTYGRDVAYFEGTRSP